MDTPTKAIKTDTLRIFFMIPSDFDYSQMPRKKTRKNIQSGFCGFFSIVNLRNCMQFPAGKPSLIRSDQIANKKLRIKPQNTDGVDLYTNFLPLVFLTFGN